jgi:hypothetical protein
MISLQQGGAYLPEFRQKNKENYAQNGLGRWKNGKPTFRKKREENQPYRRSQARLVGLACLTFADSWGVFKKPAGNSVQVGNSRAAVRGDKASTPQGEAYSQSRKR